MSEYKKMLIGAKVSAPMADKVREQAAAENITISAVVEKIITYYYTERSKEPVPPIATPSADTVSGYIVDLKKLETTKFAWLLELSEKLSQPDYTQLLNSCVKKLEGAYGIANSEFLTKAAELQKGE